MKRRSNKRHFAYACGAGNVFSSRLYLCKEDKIAVPRTYPFNGKPAVFKQPIKHTPDERTMHSAAL
jgi:hypothetical protein